MSAGLASSERAASSGQSAWRDAGARGLRGGLPVAARLELRARQARQVVPAATGRRSTTGSRPSRHQTGTAGGRAPRPASR